MFQSKTILWHSTHLDLGFVVVHLLSTTVGDMRTTSECNGHLHQICSSARKDGIYYHARLWQVIQVSVVNSGTCYFTSSWCASIRHWWAETSGSKVDSGNRIPLPQGDPRSKHNHSGHLTQKSAHRVYAPGFV